MMMVAEDERSGRFSRRSRRMAVTAAAGFAVLLCCAAAAAAAEGGDVRSLDDKTALIVIDVQAFYFPGGFMPLVGPEKASANCGKLIERFRSEDLVIVHVEHNVSKDGAFHPDVTPADGEKVIMKDEVSAFNGTELLEFLRAEAIDRLVICGMQTHMCVEGAVRAGYDLGFECVLVEDACATRALSWGDSEIDAAGVHASTLATLKGGYAAVIDTGTFLKTY
jgi:nicotinamidase-related amidase